MIKFPALSYWEMNNPAFRTDICIVGGGFTAAWTAFFLSKKRPDLKITIIETMIGGRAASTRNAGFLCYGSPSEILADIESMGEEKAIEIVCQRLRGLKMIKELVPADLGEINYSGGKEFFPPSLNHLWEKTVSRLDYLNQLVESHIGFQPYCIGPADQSFRTGNCIHIREEGSVNPAALLFFLNSELRKRGVNIVEGTKISQIEKQEDRVLLRTEQGGVYRAGKVLLATNGLTESLVSGLPEIRPARNVVCMLKTSVPLNLIGCYHTNEGYVYYRKVSDYLLIGGGRNWFAEEEYTSSMEVRQEIVDKLVNFAKDEIFHPKCQFKALMSWSGIMGVGSEKSPVFEWVDQHILVAARLSGMGVALSPVLGQKAAAELGKHIDG